MTLIHHVIMDSSRPPIVFAPGFACAHSDSDAQVAHLSVLQRRQVNVGEPDQTNALIDHFLANLLVRGSDNAI